MRTVVQPAGIAELLIFDAFQKFWLCETFTGSSFEFAPTITNTEIMQGHVVKVALKQDTC